MSIVKILLGVIDAILKASVEAFLAVASLGIAWLLGIALLVLIVLAGLSGFGGWRVLSKRRNKDQP